MRPCRIYLLSVSEACHRSLERQVNLVSCQKVVFYADFCSEILRMTAMTVTPGTCTDQNLVAPVELLPNLEECMTEVSSCVGRFAL